MMRIAGARWKNSVPTKKCNYPTDHLDDVIRYVSQGVHAFVACDDQAICNDVACSLGDSLAGWPTEMIDGCSLSGINKFGSATVTACRNLVEAIKGPAHRPARSLHECLEQAMQAFGTAERQGFLIITDIDEVIALQRTIEIEGAMRSAMQRYDDIAVVMFGSNDCINRLVGDYDRPFYMSFRVFRL